MKSHTVPRKLLEQFSYYEPSVKALRLWRYQRGHAPYGHATLRKATMMDGHFSNPSDEAKEAELESRLNQEFEQPVNEFIEQIGFVTFPWSPVYIRKLASYVTLLFHRSKARRLGTQQQLDVSVSACKSILQDEGKLREIAASLTLSALLEGQKLGRDILDSDVRSVLEKMIEKELAKGYLQQSYAESIERAMSMVDQTLLNGAWGTLRTVAENPFIIGDAPVVTLIRYADGSRSLGEGFRKPDVEVLLPISPLACLHILPTVERTRQVVRPTVLEVNTAQASFASDFCFSHKRDDVLDGVLQPIFSTLKIGVNGYSIRYKGYEQTLFDIMRGTHVRPHL